MVASSELLDSAVRVAIDAWKLSGMNNDPWASAELAEAPAGWILATENGWGALVVWAAGQGNFVRVRAASGDRYGTVVHRLQNGSANDWNRSF